MTATDVALRAWGWLRRPVSARLLCALLATYAAAGAWILRDARALPAVEWMALYRLADFTDFGAAWQFFCELHTGIPPLLAALEVTEYLLTGDVWLSDVLLYRLAMLLAFGLPIVAFRRCAWRTLAAFPLCLLFLASARIVSASNAQLYDPLLPALLMGALLCLRAAPRQPRFAALLAATAGAALATAELSRPFVLFLLPPLLLFGGWVLRELPRRCLVAFLLPVLLLSGGWHAKLWLAHDGQLTWSNNGGFNLYRAWGREVREWPDYVGKRFWLHEPAPLEDDAFQGTGKWFRFRWNTQRHTERSSEMTRAVLAHVAREPGASAAHALKRIRTLLGPKIHLGMGGRLGRLREPYRLAVRLTAAFSLAALGALAVRLVRRRARALREVETAWLPTTWLLVFFLAVGDQGDEPRFLISVLPLLAALPWPGDEPAVGSSPP